VNPAFNGKLEPPDIISSLQCAFMLANSRNQQQNEVGGDGHPAPPNN